jgi:ABC-type phosphate transport system substrate-binding protein
MSGHHAKPGRKPSHAPFLATAAVAAIVLVALGACTSTTSTGTTTSPASPLATASAVPAGHPGTLTGADSTFDASFFSVAFARYQQQHPSVTVSYSAVGPAALSSAGTRARARPSRPDPGAQREGIGRFLVVGVMFGPPHAPYCVRSACPG